jgi:phosphatidylinositol glycan class M
VWRFGIITAISLLAINGTLWSMCVHFLSVGKARWPTFRWGDPFIGHTFLYHLTRKDHRHNFSPYFYPIYLSLFGRSTTSGLLDLLRHPLASFVPQATLVLGSGWILTPTAGLPFAMFVQTVAFVVFNKVCTSQVSQLRLLPRMRGADNIQYFMWFLALIPPIIPRLHLSASRASLLIGAWIAGQAVWLGTAYRLELLAQDAFLGVWSAGIGLFGVSVWVLGELVDAHARSGV